MDKKEEKEIYEALKSFQTEGTKNLQGKLEQELVRLMEKAQKAYDEGDWKTALKYWKEAVELEPDYPDAWMSKGLFFFTQDKDRKAVECIKKALKLAREQGS